MTDLVIFTVLLLLGFGFGSVIEKRHYASIRKREAEWMHLPTIMLKRPLEPEHIVSTRLVSGNVVISIDFFKKFVAGLVNLFGGNVSAYETLVDRARREAVLRMKQDAGNASEIVNIRIETSSISKNTQNGIGSVEVLAYGTAVYR
jgi:uncharacterized protein YbjQ (UPF0145 family)